MFWISVGLIVASAIAFAVYGLNLGVDFVGGSVFEFSFDGERPGIEDVKAVFEANGVVEPALNYAGDNGLIVKTVDLSEEQHQQILAELAEAFPGIQELRFESVGPVVGDELRSNSVTAIILALIGIAIYIAVAFRKLSRTISPWVMGLATISALVLDIMVPIGVFSVLGHFLNVEISAIFVAALLTILGYAIADAVVIFDRVRENIIRGNSASDFPTLVHNSVMQTLSRSISTGLAAVLSLIAIYFFGGESIKWFALAMIIGILLGASSGIFFSAPLLVWWHKWKRA